MPDESTRTVLVALGAGLGVTLAKVGAAVLTGSAAMAAEAAHSLADNANDLSLFVAQRRSSRPPDDQHPLGYGREAYFWALIAALGVLVVGVAFSLRDGIDELIHPTATQVTGSSVPQGVAAVLIALVMIRVSLRLIQRSHDLLVGAWAGSGGGPQGHDVAGFTQPGTRHRVGSEAWSGRRLPGRCRAHRRGAVGCLTS
jgi:cation diffusion facilitator family transporter